MYIISFFARNWVLINWSYVGLTSTFIGIICCLRIDICFSHFGTRNEVMFMHSIKNIT